MNNLEIFLSYWFLNKENEQMRSCYVKYDPKIRNGHFS
jgi:hypothetical protein